MKPTPTFILNRLLKLFNVVASSTPIVAIRVTALFSCVIWLMTPLVVSLVTYAQDSSRSRREVPDIATQQYLQNIQNEHRFSVLETKIGSIDDRTSFMQNTMWGLIIGMSGLLGERGVALVKNRQRLKGESNEDQ